MTPDTIPQTVLFPDLFAKPLVATFDREQASSDGGAVLLKAAERVYGVVKAFARCQDRATLPGPFISVSHQARAAVCRRLVESWACTNRLTSGTITDRAFSRVPRLLTHPRAG